MKACEKAASDFSSAASNAISGLNSPINALADNIRTNLISAIDEASARWQQFQQEMAMQASIPMPAGGGGGVTNNSSSNVQIESVNINAGNQNGQTFGNNFVRSVQANSGLI
jgi:hypothetical protein